MKRNERLRVRGQSLDQASSMKTLGDSDAEPGHPGKETHHVNGDIRIAGDVNANLPPDITKEYVSSSQKENTREDRRFVVERITLVFVILVAIISMAQFCASRLAIQQAKDQFVADQRPYLLIHRISTVHMAVGDPMMADVQWVNFGKTPAVHEKNISRIVFGRDALALADQFFIDAPGESVPVTTSSEAVIAQGTHDCGSDDKTGNVNFDCGSTTSKSDNAIGNAVDIVDATTNDTHLLIVGRIYYKDTAGNKYNTDYCFRRLRTGVLAYCTNHNDVK